MDKQPAFGVYRPPGVFARHIFEEGQRLSLFIAEQQEAQAFGKALLQPFDLGLIALVLRIRKATDAAIRQVFGTNFFQRYLIHSELFAEFTRYGGEVTFNTKTNSKIEWPPLTSHTSAVE